MNKKTRRFIPFLICGLCAITLLLVFVAFMLRDTAGNSKSGETDEQSAQSVQTETQNVVADEANSDELADGITEEVDGVAEKTLKFDDADNADDVDADVGNDATKQDADSANIDGQEADTDLTADDNENSDETAENPVNENSDGTQNTSVEQAGETVSEGADGEQQSEQTSVASAGDDILEQAGEAPAEQAGESASTEQPVESAAEPAFAQQPAESAATPHTGGHIVVIDPGHQSKGMSEKEPNGPGSSTMKAKVTGGTSGRTTGLPEYQLALTIGLKLKTELTNRGYTVVMTRESNDVSLSNVDRAQIANNAGAEAFVRIHANGSEDSSVNGAMTVCQTSSNPYNAAYYSQSRKLSDCVLDAFTAATGCKKQYVWETDTMTGINWANVPSTIIEMGYMTNPTEDTNMASEDYQQKMVQGIANGVDNYFAN